MERTWKEIKYVIHNRGPRLSKNERRTCVSLRNGAGALVMAVGVGVRIEWGEEGGKSRGRGEKRRRLYVALVANGTSFGTRQ